VGSLLLGRKISAERGIAIRAPIRLHRSKLNDEVQEILTWLEAGCPVEPPLVAQDHVEGGAEAPYQLNCWVRPKSGENGWTWQNVKELARYGVPEEHKLHKFPLMLARPLLFRDYYELDLPERLQRTRTICGSGSQQAQWPKWVRKSFFDIIGQPKVTGQDASLVQRLTRS